MLFNSYTFLFLFLPVALLGYFLAARVGREPALGWLVLVSLFFYGWWNPVYLILLAASILINFQLGRMLSTSHENNQRAVSKVLLLCGIVFNLALLGYFKYANFAVDTVSQVVGESFHIDKVVLPLAISFFTFQQIAYLVDARRGITHEYSFLHYCLFVCFFPQLIAGPIVHHRDMVPQFMHKDSLHPEISNIAIGITIISIGLFKKVVLADGVAEYARPIFSQAESGDPLTFFIAWGGALAYTMQLYFDFSGYCDMAIGAARMFGVRLPINFHSPYKSTSIVEFWRRWHMTLSKFLRDYLYIPLGGNRGTLISRHKNLMLTMVLGGLWHGAGWTFVIWGFLHGIYLIINHTWNSMYGRSYIWMRVPTKLRKAFGWTLTFVAVVVGWVFFRAESLEGALQILQGMAGYNGIAIPNAIAARLGGSWTYLEQLGVQTYLGGGSEFVFTWIWIAILLPAVCFMPNTQLIMIKAEPAINSYQGDSNSELSTISWLNLRLRWHPNRRWAVFISLVLSLGILALNRVSEFLYFQF